MADKTGIEWTDASWNPVTGCSKVSQGCKFCYAKHQAWPRLAAMPNSIYAGREFEQVACHPERLDQPLRWTKPRKVFVNSMSDLFHEDVSFEFIDRVFAVMALAPKHTFQVLTKRPERMLRYFTHHFTRSKCARHASEFSGRRDSEGGGDIRVSDGQFPLPNVWLGVSVEDQAAADERIPLLLQTPAAVRWISAEPLLGPVALNLAECLNGCGWITPVECNNGKDLMCPSCKTLVTRMHGGIMSSRKIDWVVVGGESGPNARPMHPDWARSLRDQCAAAGVPFLFKQWGEYGPRETAIAKYGPDYDPENNVEMARIGKRFAGRRLDGVQHDGYPA